MKKQLSNDKFVNLVLILDDDTIFIYVACDTTRTGSKLRNQKLKQSMMLSCTPTNDIYL